MMGTSAGLVLYIFSVVPGLEKMYIETAQSIEKMLGCVCVSKTHVRIIHIKELLHSFFKCLVFRQISKATNSA